ncbi:aminotransferase class I/II-fold pyridoxal phosphate-dependent enzyme [Plantactinospora sp. CA-290183]|uniref:aminotransferase class I/II-fold pyridoxal phosphate-dependent enzyme n=1 Tax=Plantactinospora sp. CA-290183 TaxID=3240006 RepID=UPI003D943988
MKIDLTDPRVEAFKSWVSQDASPFFPLVEANIGNTVRMNGREALMFGSCDYLGLSQNAEIVERSIEAIRAFGTNTYGSQALCGHTVLHHAVEEHLARIHFKETALMFPSGFAANLAVLTTLAGPEDVIINDHTNHVSIFTGSRLSGAEVRTFLHNDMVRLERVLAKSGDRRRRIVVVDGLYSADGDLAPLDQIVDLAKRYDALVVVDEAHSFGVVGPRGLGAADHFGVLDDVDVVVGTMSKALGSVGGFVVANEQINLMLRALAPSYTSSRGSAPAVAGATLASLEYIEKHGADLRSRLNENVQYVTSTLRAEGFDLLDTCSQIVPVLIGSEEKTAAVARWLMDNGVFTAAFVAPTVPKNKGRLRIGVTATHTLEECRQLCVALKQADEKFSLT